MSALEPPYLRLDTGEEIPITVRGYQLLNRPMLNRGTAFTLAERDALGLTGLLPPGTMPLEAQVKRVYRQYTKQPTNLSKNIFMTQLRDRNEVLYYRLLAEHIEEMLPIVYTPTIGEAIEQYSAWYVRPRGVYLSIDRPEAMEESLLNYGLTADEVDLVVVTDSEGILGIGDQGVGGIAITTGKLSVYTAAAGYHPRRAVPVVLDVGTDNLRLLNNENYLGERHSRVGGERYDEFVDRFMDTVTRLFPKAMIHFEDFGTVNAHKLLAKYRDTACVFNDDIQGTAAVVLAAVLAGVRRTGGRLTDQRIVVFGAGAAGIGISNTMRDAMIEHGLTKEEASRQFWCVDKQGLLTQSMQLRPFQQDYARPDGEVAAWERGLRGIGLEEVIRRVHPTILIGTSAQTGAFTKQVVREMHKGTARPIIMPLSNPTARAEATPHNIIHWTEGKALVATGSPFPNLSYDGQEFHIAQANNALVFPGLGLGVAVCQASRVTDKMVIAAAHAISEIAPSHGVGRSLLPSFSELRTVSSAVAVAVCAAAAAEGVARVEITRPVQQVLNQMWHPRYAQVVLADDDPQPGQTGMDTASKGR